MTIRRSIATWLITCLFVPVLTGQEAGIPIDSTRLSPSRMQMITAPEAADSAGQVLDVPNVFTPNGDGVNDYFEVATDGTTVYTFRVFTRNGTQIYYSKSPRISWNGKNSSGTDVTAGIYYYVIEEVANPDPFEKAGFIHLFR
jgi:gliding motility-associated-like protein